MAHTPQTRPGLSDGQRRAHAAARKNLVCCLVAQDRTIPLPPGELLIGRGSSCDLLVDDMLASRTHARVTVTEEAVLLTDLDSTNGVYLNEIRLLRPTPLRDGDRILIGGMEMSFFVMDVRDVVTRRQQESRASRAAEPSVGPEPATHKAEVLDKLGRLADRAFAEGRIDAAERLLGEHLHGVLAGARSGRTVPPDVLRSVADYGLKLAAATGQGAWVDLVIELHMITRRPLPLPAVEVLEKLLSIAPGWDHELFLMYQAVLGGVSPGLNEADRFLCARICALSASGAGT